MAADSFIRELKREVNPRYKKITGHPLVVDIQRGKLPRAKLRIFAEQEYHYVANIYDYFALSVLNADDRDVKELFIEVANREVAYLGLYGEFLRALRLSESELKRSEPLPGAIAAPNYLFYLAVSASMAENLAAFLLIEESWIEVCGKIHRGLKEHYRLPDEALKCFAVPPIDFSQEEGLILRHARTAEERRRTRLAARLALEYERMFFDAVYGA